MESFGSYAMGLGKGGIYAPRMPIINEETDKRESVHLIYKTMNFNELMRVIEEKTNINDIILVLQDQGVKHFNYNDRNIEVFNFNMLDIVSWSTGLSLLKNGAVLEDLNKVITISMTGKMGEVLYNKYPVVHVFELDHFQKIRKRNPDTGDEYQFYTYKYGIVKQDQDAYFLDKYKYRLEEENGDGERKEPIDFSQLGKPQTTRKTPAKRQKKE